MSLGAERKLSQGNDLCRKAPRRKSAQRGQGKAFWAEETACAKAPSAEEM